MKKQQSGKKPNIGYVEFADVKTVNGILDNVNKKRMGELKQLYQQVRTGEIRIVNPQTKDAVCLYLSDLIVERIHAKGKSPIRTVISVLCMITAAFLLICMYIAYKNEEASELGVKNVQEVYREAVEKTVTHEEKNKEIGKGKNYEEIVKEEREHEVLPGFVELKEINQDLYGWITINGTKIDYPIVKTTDNEFYLSHDFYKKEDSMGTLFLDCRNLSETDTNLIVYGHNMKNGDMFGGLEQYKEYEYFRQHKTIMFKSLYKEYTYEIIAVCTTKVAYADEEGFRYYNFTNASTGEDLKEFWENVEKHSLYDVSYEFSEDDNYLTLSTCSSFTENGRLYLVAVKEKQ